jgi:hypothetical protein
MKPSFLVAFLTASTALAGGSGKDMPADHHMAAKPDSAVFAWMKTLTGTWQAQDDKGQKFTVTYSMVGGDRCVKEVLDMGPHTMDTFYCDNGDSVVATHYCSSGNQPRLKAQALTPSKKGTTFDFLDATGMVNPDEGHMHKLVLEMTEPNKLVQKWSFYEKGAEQKVSTFTLAKAAGSAKK